MGHAADHDHNARRTILREIAYNRAVFQWVRHITLWKTAQIPPARRLDYYKSLLLMVGGSQMKCFVSNVTFDECFGTWHCKLLEIWETLLDGLSRNFERHIAAKLFRNFAERDAAEACSWDAVFCRQKWNLGIVPSVFDIRNWNPKISNESESPKRKYVCWAKSTKSKQNYGF